MNKYFSLLLLIIISFAVKGQNIPNGDFENWVNYTGYSAPVSWHTTDSVASTQAGQRSVLEDTIAVEVHSGHSAMKLQTWIYAPGTFNFAIPGAATNGNLNTNTFQFEAGTPDTVRHDMLTGWYIYHPVAGDTMTVLAALSKWNGSTRDTVAEGIFRSSDSITAYQQFVVHLNYHSPYQSSGNPDTMLIIIISGNITVLNTAMPGTELYIDDLNFSGINGIKEVNRNAALVNVYPNPAVDMINIEFKQPLSKVVMSILDVHGQLVQIAPLNKKTNQIDISSLSNGNYFYELKDEKGVQLGTGRFAVKR